MKEVFIEYKFQVRPKQPTTDILIAELGELGFESFMETKDGLLAYIDKKHWETGSLENVPILHNSDFSIIYEKSEVDQQNWNAKWEENFQPITLGHYCAVRAPFHPVPNVKYDIVITPKMSFGTGHHETTHMMLQFVLKTDVAGKSILDMGCGTAVLAILAAMKGAGHVHAVDVDPWSYQNALENVKLNDHKEIEVTQGDATSLADRKYDVILANINRNTLLADIPSYVAHLNKGGILILSGFYKQDLPLISEKCASCGLSFQENLENNDWVSAKYVF